MSIFYTSVDRVGNDILFRGYKDGKPIKAKIPFQPTLYIPSSKPTEFKTLDGTFVGPLKMG